MESGKWVLTYEMFDDETMKSFYRSETFASKEQAVNAGTEYENTLGFPIVSIKPEEYQTEPQPKPKMEPQQKNTFFSGGRTITEEEQESGEDTLYHLLWEYQEYILKEDLRLELNIDETPERYYIDNHHLMKPGELYKAIDAASTLLSLLLDRKVARLKDKAAAGDQDAADLLKSLDY